MRPWELLADHIRSLTSEVTVYETPTAQLDTPCYAIVPGEPWMDPSGRHSSFSNDEEAYEVWAITKSAVPWAAMPLIHSMLHAVRHNLPEGWAFVSAGTFVDIPHAGPEYYGAPLRVTYNNCDSGESESS